MLICFHDDFDGVASAALIAAFLRDTTSWPLHMMRFKPVDYDLETTWRQPVLPWVRDGERLVVVDFRYHPSAWLYFDHHPTTFLTTADRAHFDRRVQRLSSWRPGVVSCARVIAEAVDELWPRGHKYRDLVAAADLIDGARYASPQEFYESDHPALVINRAYRSLSEGQKAELARTLAVTPVEAVAEIYRGAADSAKAQDLRALETLEPYLRVQGGVGVIDTVGTAQPNPQFASYYFRPDLEYTVTARSGPNGEVWVSLGHNPWRADATHWHLGQLAKQYGGGGHPYAAGIEFRGDNATAMGRRVVQDLVTYLNRPVPSVVLAGDASIHYPLERSA